MALRRAVAVVACLAAMLGSAKAEDDALQSCRNAHEAADRLSACSAVIDSPEFTAGQRATAFRLRGLERQDAGALDDALADLSAALSLSPKDSVAYAARAKVR